VQKIAVLKNRKRKMIYESIDTLGTMIVLGTIVAAIAIIFSAYMLLRPGWRFARCNALILLALIFDLLFSLRVFEPSALRRQGALVEPGTELLYCFVVPLAVWTIALFVWKFMREVNDDMPLSWTIWPQTFRAIGGIFLVYWAVGQMNGGFAIPAGLGDLFVGITAPLMTRYVRSRTYSTRLVAIWNLLGVLDFVVPGADRARIPPPFASQAVAKNCLIRPKDDDQTGLVQSANSVL
jgi:hypothetical protein